MRSGAFLCEFFSFEEKKAKGCGDNKLAEQYRSALHVSAGHYRVGPAMSASLIQPSSGS